MNIAAGKLRHRVELVKPVYSRDPVSGEQTIGEQRIKVWADKQALSGRELVAAQSEQSLVRYNITIRYRADVDANCWVEHRGLKFDILGVLPDNDSGLEYIKLPCSEGVSVTGQ